MNDEFNLLNLTLQQGDIYSLEQNFLHNCEGVISLQILNWMPDLREPLAAMMQISPAFITISSLFMGDVSATTQILEHKCSRTTFLITYNFSQVALFVRKHWYHPERFEPFQIDVDMPKLQGNNSISTYTLGLNQFGSMKMERLQFPRPLALNWYFLMIKCDTH